jgi:hypothetical protein
VTILLTGHNFCLRLVTDGEDLGRALSIGFVKGDFACQDPERDLKRFLRLLTKPKKTADGSNGEEMDSSGRNNSGQGSSLKVSWMVKWIRDRYNEDVSEPSSPQPESSSTTTSSASSSVDTIHGNPFSNPAFIQIPSIEQTQSTPSSISPLSKKPFQISNFKLLKGLCSVWFEEWYFARITNFALDPYGGVNKRVVRYVEEIVSEGVESVEVEEDLSISAEYEKVEKEDMLMSSGNSGVKKNGLVEKKKEGERVLKEDIGFEILDEVGHVERERERVKVFCKAFKEVFGDVVGAGEK